MRSCVQYAPVFAEAGERERERERRERETKTERERERERRGRGTIERNGNERDGGRETVERISTLVLFYSSTFPTLGPWLLTFGPWPWCAGLPPLTWRF